VLAVRYLGLIGGTLASLVDTYARHVLALAAARAGAGAVPAGRLAAHAVTALARAPVIDDLRDERWPMAAAAHTASDRTADLIAAGAHVARGG
jgi:hypothetical protein